MSVFIDSKFWRDSLSRDAVVRYGRAVKHIASADGSMSIAELDLFFDDARSRGVSESILLEWEEYDCENGSLEKTLKLLRPVLTKSLEKLLLFDAIRVAIEDSNYPLEEQDAVRRAAELLEIDDRTVVELETLASLDKNVTDLKRLTFLESD